MEMTTVLIAIQREQLGPHKHTEFSYAYNAQEYIEVLDITYLELNQSD